MNRSVAITGSSGFVGGALASRFAKAGWNVLAMQRKPGVPSGKLQIVPFELNKPFAEEPLKHTDLLIHCAWQPYSRKVPQADEINFEGAKNLRAFARRTGAKFIFISTTSAHAGAASHYGMSKLKTESLMDNSRDLTLKPGLVISADGGLFQKIAGIIGKSKIIPMVDGGTQPMQTVWIEDLFHVIMKSNEVNLCGNYAVAESEAVTMKQLYGMIANKLNVKPVFINIPYAVIYPLMRLPEMLRLPLPFTTENLKGLKQLGVFDTDEIQRKLGIRLLSARETIERI